MKEKLLRGVPLLLAAATPTSDSALHVAREGQWRERTDTRGDKRVGTEGGSWMWGRSMREGCREEGEGMNGREDLTIGDTMINSFWYSFCVEQLELKLHKIHSKIKGREGEKQQKTRSDRGITTKNRNRNRDTGKDKEAKDKSEKKKGKQTDDKRKIREKYKEKIIEERRKKEKGKAQILSRTDRRES